MKLLKLGAICVGSLFINGCAVYDSVQAVRDSAELYEKKDQMLISKEKAQFIDGVQSIHVTYIEKDLEANKQQANLAYAKMFCMYYADSSLLSNLADSGAVVPKCVTGEERGDIAIVITESTFSELGFWPQAKFEAVFTSNDGRIQYHSIDRNKSNIANFSEVVIGLTGTIIDVNRS